MTIQFTEDRWNVIRESARLWWQGQLGRPLIQPQRAAWAPGADRPPDEDAADVIAVDVALDFALALVAAVPVFAGDSFSGDTIVIDEDVDDDNACAAT